MTSTPTINHAKGRAIAFEVAPTDAALGAEIRGVDLAHLDDATFEQIHQAWLQGQDRTRASQIQRWVAGPRVVPIDDANDLAR